jgi:hypothetical protein
MLEAAFFGIRFPVSGAVPGNRIPETGYRMPDTGYRMPDTTTKYTKTTKIQVNRRENGRWCPGAGFPADGEGTVPAWTVPDARRMSEVRSLSSLPGRK